MNTTFDVISDLYLENLDDFTWEGKRTSIFCIVAGNISQHRDILFEFLDEISSYYNAVFFIDGQLEHQSFSDDFAASYQNLEDGIEYIDRVVFLHENIVVLDNATIVATNGWTNFNFCNKNHDIGDTIEFLDLRGLKTIEESTEVLGMSLIDSDYMYQSIATCQSMNDCNNIIVVTNTVPLPNLINHNNDYDGTALGDMTGNNGIAECLDNDIKNKVKTWVFGNFPEDLDYNIDGVRYMNNPAQHRDINSYYPKQLSF